MHHHATAADGRRTCIHPKDRRYVFVDDGDPDYPIYRLTCAGVPCIEGEDGIVQRFMNGAKIGELADDYGASPRSIVAAIRTMHRFWKGLRS